MITQLQTKRGELELVNSQADSAGYGSRDVRF